MSHRSDTVRSITLIAGSAFAAVGLTTFLVMAREKPAEEPTQSTELTTVVVKPMSVSGFVVGKVDAAPEAKAGNSRSLVVTGTSATGPIVFVDGVQVEGTTNKALTGIAPANIEFVDLIKQGVGQEGQIRIRTKAGAQEGKDGNDR